MTKIIWVTCALLVTVIEIRAQFQDDFADQDTHSNPSWTGDTHLFDASSERLVLTAPAEPGQAGLVTSSQAVANGHWAFNVEMLFNPSASNYCKVYLLATDSNLFTSLNGYYVQIGGSLDDVRLYEQVGTQNNTIIDGEDGRVNLSTVNIFVEVRYNDGTWSLSTTMADQSHIEGSAYYPTTFGGSYFGIACIYTATRSDKFIFDSIYVSGDAFKNPYAKPEVNSVIITELMIDPTPSHGLPETEYIELYNNTDSLFNTKGWVISDATTSDVLGEYVLEPHSYLLLVPSKEQWYGIANTIEVNSFPSLNNDTDEVKLMHQETTLDSLQYDNSWYHSSMGVDGGWSMERIDLNNPCSDWRNWIITESTGGGTPGIQNSVWAEKPDLTAPVIQRVNPAGATEVLVVFDEQLEHEATATANFQIVPQMDIASVKFKDNAKDRLVLVPDASLIEGTVYHLTLSGIRDCNGNEMSRETVEFVLPSLAERGDIIVNEILFDPIGSGVDFVELVNRSHKHIDISRWSIDNESPDHSIITDEPFVIAPGAYIAFTESIETLRGDYPRANIENLMQASLPPLPNENGVVRIFNENGLLIDSVSYNQQMHSPLLVDSEGISLERTGLNEVHAWVSASPKVRATPGYRNSTLLDATYGQDISVEPPVFEPIIGQPNFAAIHYQFEHPGYVANVKICDARGHLVKTIANNDLLGTSGFYTWNGDTANGDRATIGFYFVWFQVFDLKGDAHTYRERIVIASSR